MHQIQQQRLCKSVELEERARHSGNRQPSRQRAWHHVYSGARGSIPGTNSPASNHQLPTRQRAWHHVHSRARGSIPGTNSPASNPQTAGSPVPMLSACSWQPGTAKNHQCRKSTAKLWQPGKISCRESTATKGIPVGTIPGDNRQTAECGVARLPKGLENREMQRFLLK